MAPVALRHAVLAGRQDRADAWCGAARLPLLRTPVTPLPSGPYEVVYADPPWSYPSLRGVTKLPGGGYASRNPCGADAHYSTMSDAAIAALPVRDVMADRAALFMWATCPRLDVALRTIEAWGLHFRGVSYVWVKTRRDGAVMGAKGPPPAFVKPVVELVLVATTAKRGRVFPIHAYDQRQVIMAPRGRHSEKPRQVRQAIVDLCGDRPRLEMFARERSPGWDAWGDGVDP